MNTQGIGLGLVISDNIVTQFEGQIGVKSKFGRGSTFMFSVLLGRDDNYVDKSKKDDKMVPVSTMSMKNSTMSMIMPVSTLSIGKVDTF